jgi:hypothetical protein
MRKTFAFTNLFREESEWQSVSKALPRRPTPPFITA